MMKKNDFNWSNDVNIHKKRAKLIISEHPEIRTLIGRNPYTIFIAAACVILQTGLAILLKDASWLLVFLTAYIIGAFASHVLFIAIHECTHNLLFKNKTLNIWAGIFANLPLVFPSSVSFQRYHLKHHAHMGVSELDADMPFEWEARLINNRWYGKAIWLLFFPVFQLLRPFRLKLDLFDGWTIINWIIQFAFMAAVIYFLGTKATMFLVMSFFFSIGLHPLGARWIQEHYLTHGDEQETKSYYGILNKINLNVGYHNEHHDFPSIPWNNLPRVKNIASRHYDTLGYHTSYTGLLFRFLFDKDLSLYSRTRRAGNSS
jgi:sphingolipid 4-desaturase/C4-monooxygenase